MRAGPGPLILNGNALNDANKTSGDQQQADPREGSEATRHSALGNALAAAGDAAVRLESAAEKSIEQNLARHPRWRTAVSVLGWGLVAAYFVFAGIFLGLRYWLLPNIGRYSDVIERAVSEAVGERVTIGGVQAGWEGLRPEINLSDVRIHDREGRVALSLPVIEAVVGWSSVFYGTVRFESLALERPDLEVRRDAAGHLYVAGLELRGASSTPGFSDWLLAQRAVLIRDGRIAWDDGLRRARRLELDGVSLLLRNSGNMHRFALRAVTARALASAIDLRGDLRGVSAANLGEWTGKLYAELEYTDLAAWREWIDYPIEVKSGQGGVRLWLDVAGRRVTDVTADVALAGVTARIAPDLAMLELDYLRGRLGASQKAATPSAGRLNMLAGDTAARPLQLEQEVSGRGLALRTKGGVALAPADFALRLRQPAAGGAPADARGEFTANALDLQPLAQLAEFLPFPEAFRKRLAETAPRGRVFDLKYAWSGAPERPPQYVMHARFDGLALRANAGLPGFSNLSGLADATEKGGTLVIASKNASLELPDILAESRPAFETLGGQVAWKHSADKTDITFNQLAFANPSIAGSLSGSFERRAGALGQIDITGQFPRAEAVTGWRYIPFIPPTVRDYLAGAILAGRVSDAKLRLKGDLAQFPFNDPKLGTFQVAAKFNGVDFSYGEAWPRLTAASGDLLFEGLRMQVLAQRAGILGTRAVNVRASIPDLYHGNEMLTVEGQAEGPSSEFLRYIDSSPVTKMIDGATQDLRATGAGRLQIRVDLPVRNLNATRVAGNYIFQNNQVTVDELPVFTQVNGRLDFSEAGAALRGITAQWMGGPLTVSGQPRADGSVALTAQGSANIAQLRRAFDIPFLAQANGTTAWRSTALVRKRAVDVVVDSNLQGVSIDLPAPLGKTATEVLPLRVERAMNPEADLFKRYPALRLPSRGDAFAVSVGGAASGSGVGPGRLSAVVVRRPEGRGFAIERGTIALGEVAVLQDRPGLVVSGSLPVLDVERWQAALDSPPASTPAVASTSTSSTLSAINLRIAALDVAGKRFNDLSVRALNRTGQWGGTVEAKEFAGEAQWRPEGRGRVVARLKYLNLPEDRVTAQAATQAAPPAVPAAPAAAHRELPALDIVADEFSLRDKKLGKLELVAFNTADAREWRIEKLRLSTPDSDMTVDGVWQTWAARPSVNANVKLEVTDAGKYLERLGYPKVMLNGTAHLEGKIGWTGSPQSIDYPTLTGNLSLTAEKGQFLKADPGIARLLGVLSLQSLVTLDLRDLFREGFSYDTLGGTATVSKGVMATQDFRMKGPSALVNMSGTIDLARESQNLHLRVVPSVGDSASTIAGFFLANPVFGIGATILQRLLKDPLGQIFSVEYDVTGTWNDPKVARTRVDAPRGAAPNNGGTQ